MKRTAARLLLRPKTLLANAADIARLEAFLRRQAGRYGTLATPTIVITGDCDPLVPAAAPRDAARRRRAEREARDAARLRPSAAPRRGRAVVAAVEELMSRA